MREAREKINLPDLGIDGGVRIRRALTGAVKFEIPSVRGKEGEIVRSGGDIARALAHKLTEVLSNKEGVKVEVPTKMTELRVKDLDDSVTKEELAQAIAMAGGCDVTSIRVGDIRAAPSGMRTAWVKCPLLAGRQIAAQGRVAVGWARARVDALEARPLQCFRCLEGGHVRKRCPNSVDRSSRCYRCGGEGHSSRHCEGKLSCPVCSDKGLPSAHRTGGKTCASVRGGGGGVRLGSTASAGSRGSAGARGETPGVAAAATIKLRIIEVQTVKPPLRVARAVQPRPASADSLGSASSAVRAVKAKKRSEGDNEVVSTGGAEKRRLRHALREDDPTAMEVTAERGQIGHSP